MILFGFRVLAIFTNQCCKGKISIRNILALFLNEMGAVRLYGKGPWIIPVCSHPLVLSGIKKLPLEVDTSCCPMVGLPLICTFDSLKRVTQKSEIHKDKSQHNLLVLSQVSSAWCCFGGEFILERCGQYKCCCDLYHCCNISIHAVEKGMLRQWYLKMTSIVLFELQNGKNAVHLKSKLYPWMLKALGAVHGISSKKSWVVGRRKTLGELLRFK